MATKKKPYATKGSPVDLLSRALDPLVERDPLERLDCIRKLRERLKSEEDQIAFWMRIEGQSWTDIGAAFGFSRQGAQQRFGESVGLLDKLAAARGREVKP